jgi:hypothetical protein
VGGKHGGLHDFEDIRRKSRDLIPGREILRLYLSLLAVTSVNRDIFKLQIEDLKGKSVELFEVLMICALSDKGQDLFVEIEYLFG